MDYSSRSGSLFTAILPTADTIQAQMSSLANNQLIAGVRMLQNKRPEDAIPFFKKALALDSSSIDAYNYLGNTYLQLNQNDKAIDTFKKLVAMKPFDKDSAVNLGNAYSQAQKYADAEKMYKKAVALSPNDKLSHYSLGQTYLLQNKLKDAETEFLKVNRIDSRDPNGYYALGQTYNKMERYDSAISSLKKAISLKHGDFALAETELGYAYAGKEDDYNLGRQITKLKTMDSQAAIELQNATFKPKILNIDFGPNTPFLPQLGAYTPISMFTLQEPPTTITAINNGTTITLSRRPDASASGNFVIGPNNYQSGSTTLTNHITGLADTTGLYVGMTVTGKNLPPNTTIAAINSGTDITLSNAPSAAGADNFAFGPNNIQNGTTNMGNQITGLADTSGLTVGMTVTGAGLPANTTITAINDATSVTLSTNTLLTGMANYTFSGISINQAGTTNQQTNQITGLASTAGLKVGMTVTGTNIPNGMTLSQPNASKDLTAIFQFNTDMDPVSIQTLTNWSITKASGGQAGYYNHGYTLYPQREANPPILKNITYDPTNKQATLTFSLTQNAAGDAVIDPSHLVFKFSGKDADGKAMDPNADQYDGFAGTAF